MSTPYYHGWLGCWYEHGFRADNGMATRIQVGVIPPEVDPQVAIRIGDDTTPVTISRTAALGIAQLLKDALSEREMLQRVHAEQRRSVARQLLDEAMLSRDQWESLVDALQEGDPGAREEAVKQLKACAPGGWVTAEPALSPQAGDESSRDRSTGS